MKNQQDIMLKLSLDSWYSHIKRADDLLNTLSNEQLKNETALGRNTGTYLLGHLVAVHDRMLPLLNIGERSHSDVDDAFISNPDKSNKEMPSVEKLKSYWKDVNAKLATHFNNLSTDDWMQKHTSVSHEDFAKEPHRNKLSVLISRTNHLAYHFGQLAYLKQK